jgi:hypothetical protein
MLIGCAWVVVTIAFSVSGFALEVRQVGKYGKSDLQDPRQIRADPQGDLVVADQRGNDYAVVRFHPDGKKIDEVKLPAAVAGSDGPNNGSFVAVADSNGRCYIVFKMKAWSLDKAGTASVLAENVNDIDLRRIKDSDLLYILKSPADPVLELDLASEKQREIKLSVVPKNGFKVIRVRADGHLYTYAESENLVYHFDPAGELVERFGSGGGLNCGIPAGHIGPCFDVDKNGDVYWTLADYGVLDKYSADGKNGYTYNGQESWNIRWTGPLYTLSGFTLLGDYAYITDRDYKRITAIPQTVIDPAKEKDCKVVDTRVFGLKFDLKTAFPYKLFLDEKTDLQLAFSPGNRRLHDVSMEYLVRDMMKGTVASGKIACNLPGIEGASFPLPISLPKLGWYQLDLALKTGDETLMNRIAFIGRTVNDTLHPIPEKEVSGWEDVDTQAMTGMGLIRLSFKRDFEQKVQETKKHMARAKELGIPFFLEIESKEIATPANIGFIVKNYPELEVLEVVNEPNLNTSPADYVKILKACYQEAKRLNPKITILGPVQCGSELGWFTAFFKEGGGQYVDGVSVHTYERHNSMDAYHWLWKLAKLKEIMAANGCKDKPLYQTEHGYLGDYHGYILSHRWQARSLLLEYMVCDRFNMWPDKFYYFYLNEGGFADFSSQLVDGRRELYPAAMLMRSRGIMLGGRTFARALDLGMPGNWLALANLYEGKDGDVLMLVNCGAYKPVELDLTLPKEAKAFDAFGNPVELAVKAGPTRVPVDWAPLYITLPHSAKVTAALPGFHRNIAAEAKVVVDDADAMKGAAFLTNGALEYDFENEPERDGFRAHANHLPLDVTLEFPDARPISGAILYGSYADNDKCTPLEYEVLVRTAGAWKKVDAVAVPTDVAFPLLDEKIKKITWYANPWIFQHNFAPVQADAVRFHFTKTTTGMFAVRDMDWGKNSPQRVHLREAQIFGPEPTVEVRLSVTPEKVDALKPLALSAEVVSNADGPFAGEFAFHAPEGWTIEPASAPITLGKRGDRQTFKASAQPPKIVDAGSVVFQGEVLDTAKKREETSSCRATIQAPLSVGPGNNEMRGGTSLRAILTLTAGAQPVKGTLAIETTVAGKTIRREAGFVLVTAGEQREAGAEFEGLNWVGQSLDVTYVATTDTGIRCTAKTILLNIPWNILGPFDNKDGKGFDLAYAPEKKIDLAAKAQTVDGEAGWIKKQSGSDGKILLKYNCFKTTDNVVAYAATYVFSPEERKACLSCGSDDGIKAWWNGKEVIANDAHRAAAPGQELVPIILAKGWNTILLKITQGDGDWEFYCSLQDEGGAALPGLRFADAMDSQKP